jgi:5-(carboxyamino)imidazole ribonucleotide synthase
VSYNIGIIGGGQLGMMMCEEAKKLGLTTIVLDPSSDCPCSTIADELIVGQYNDLAKLDELGSKAELLSYEFENVDGKALEMLHGKFNIPQGIQPLLDSQDRLREKDNANKHGLPTVRYHNVLTLEDLKEAIKDIGYPLIYKTRREGYDGHGQVVLKSDEDIKKVLPYLEEKALGIVEEKLDFDYECSLIMIRSHDQIIHFPVGRNIHKDGILDISAVPVKMEESTLTEIIKRSEDFMKSASYYGILTIEYFVKGDKFYFNEMAPRPHNSGHYTIEGCNTNQFRELDKFLIGERMEEPVLLSPTLMKNILGRDMKNLTKLQEIPASHLHMYHKSEERPLRKLGHITYNNLTLDEYLSYKEKLNIEE